MYREENLYGREKFVCYWDTTPPTVELRSADYFTKDNGYSESDIEELANLLIGESADLSAPTQNHYVMRVE